MRKKLEFIADRIEAVLSLHQVPARVTGGTVTPRWVRFQVLPAVGAKISKIRNLSEELAAAMDVAECRVSRRGAAVAVEIPRDDPQPVRLIPLYNQLTGQPTGQPTNQSPIPPVTAILGLAEDGAPLLIRLPSPDVAHILVAGTTGSGKTMLLQTMILSLAMTNPAGSLLSANGSRLNMVLIDPKGHAFGLFEGLPHLARGVIRDAEEMAEALQSLVRLMERRNGPAPRVVVVIDELADLLMMGGKAVQEPLTRLTQRGREAGIHIIAATQKPTSAVLGPLVKANFPVRLVGRVTSAEDARTASGWSGTGAERLLGRGDFIAVAEGRVTRFQVAHVSPTEIREVVGRMGDGQVLSVTPSLAPSRPISLPWPVSQLTGVMRRSIPGGASC
jgi:S-DNA-T family DNA segregation ATPase FtsK/SpoIIIE